MYIEKFYKVSNKQILHVNKVNLVHNLFLVYLSISTHFGRQCAHHQEIQLYTYVTLGTCYFVWMSAYHTVIHTE
jgi:hypothetical protein